MPALGEAGRDGPAKGVQWCQLWAEKSKEVEDKAESNRDWLKNHHGLVPGAYS